MKLNLNALANWTLDPQGPLRFEKEEFAQMRRLYPAALHLAAEQLALQAARLERAGARRPLEHFECRLKSAQSISDKLRRLGLPQTYAAMRRGIRDVAGARAVLSYVGDVYDLAFALRTAPGLRVLYTKDYIASPKKSGYRGLHLIAEARVVCGGRAEYVPVEIQLRTMAMDFWASLEHQLRYKSPRAVPVAVALQLASLAERINDADLEMQQIYHALAQSQAAPA